MKSYLADQYKPEELSSRSIRTWRAI